MAPALNDWPDNEEFQRFLSRASDEARFKELAKNLDRKSQYLEEICHLCWDLCKAEQERVQKRLDEVNFASMKQVMALKVQLGRSKNYIDKDNLVEFYEPLRYLQDTTKNLVLNIVGDKVNQIIDGSAPPSLVKAVAKARDSDGGELQERCKIAEQRAEAAEASAANLQQRLQETEVQVEKLQKIARTREADLRASKEREKALQIRVDELATDLAATRVQVKQLQDENARLEREMAEFQAKIEALERELAETKAAYNKVVAELGEAKEKICKLQRQCDQLEQRARVAEAKLLEAKVEIDSLKEKCRKLEDKVVVAEAWARKAEAEAAELRAELARRNNTKSVGTQTSMKGEHIVEQKEENKRLKGMLEELRMKVNDLMAELRKRGLGKDAKDVLSQVGLDTLIKAESCFQRLYDDAMDRIHRMEKLRERIVEERKPDLARFIPTPQVLEKAIENSTIEKDVRAQEDRQVVEREYMQAPVPSLGVSFNLPQLPGAALREDKASSFEIQVECQYTDHPKRGPIPVYRSMSKTDRQFSILPPVFAPATRGR